MIIFFFTMAVFPRYSGTSLHSAVSIHVPLNSTCSCWLMNVLTKSMDLDSVSFSLSYTQYETCPTPLLMSLSVQNGAMMKL